MFCNSLWTEPARADLLCLGQEHRHSWDAVPGSEGVTPPAWGDLAHPANPFGRSESATISQQLGSQQSTSSFRPPAASGLLLFRSYSRGGRRSPSQHTNSSARLVTEQELPEYMQRERSETAALLHTQMHGFQLQQWQKQDEIISTALILLCKSPSTLEGEDDVPK